MTAYDLRDHASQCRAVAATMPAGVCREVLLTAARDYERRARRVEVLGSTQEPVFYPVMATAG